MARNKRSASPERAKKKRKVVLVKAQQAAAERGRAAVKPTAKVARAKPAPIPGGTAGRLLEWLGHGRTDTPRLGSNTERADVQVEKQEKPQKPLVPEKAPKVSVRVKQSSTNTSKKGRQPAESESDSSSDSRSSSPDSRSPTSPVLAVVTPAKVTKRPKAASPKKVKKRAAPPAASLAPAKAKKANDGSSVPTKAKKTEAPPAPVKVKKPPPEKPKPKRVEAVQVVTPAAAPAAQPELSELDQMGLQDAVLERLRTLCDKDVDPKVLAEYIVVLAQMNKGPDHLSGELEAFFSDKALLQSFVRWVEECKWSFVPGGQPLKPRSAPTGAERPVDFNNGMVRLAAKSAEALAGPKTVRQGPHVAVTSRVVLQPNPNFDASPSARAIKAPAPVSSPLKSPLKSPLSKVPSTRPYVMPPRHSAEAQQVQLLGEFTKTLQSILTKLQNTELPDSQREKYQAMADKIHNKIKTIKLAGSVRRR